MTTAPQPPLASSDEPNPDAPTAFTPRLSGFCACCGAETRSLFAMGHDARFRGFLQRALAGDKATPGNWNNRVDWFVDHSTALRVTVSDALAFINRLIRRDWTEKVATGAARISKRPVDSAPTRIVVVPEDSAGRFNPAEFTDQRVERLMRSLARPMTGKWGWLSLKGLVDGDDSQVSGRVARTYPDHELDSSLWHIDVWVPEFRKTFVNVMPANFSCDEAARE